MQRCGSESDNTKTWILLTGEMLRTCIQAPFDWVFSQTFLTNWSAVPHLPLIPFCYLAGGVSLRTPYGCWSLAFGRRSKRRASLKNQIHPFCAGYPTASG